MGFPSRGGKALGYHHGVMRLRDVLAWPLIFWPEDSSRPVSISLATGSEREARAREQLLRLLDRYDLRRWQATNRVRIEQGVIPHSHPVLTLNTKYLDNDALALSTYLHEQLHWSVWRRNPRKRRAIRELRQRYPSPPVGHPEGASSEYESYLHYLVCYLEYATMIEVVGPDQARRVVDFWCTDHYTEIYKTVLQDFDAIREIVARHGLVV